MTIYTKKVCLLGDFAVGKTSLVRRFVYDIFSDNYKSSIGVKVSRKRVSLTSETETLDITMMLWDISSNEEFVQVRNSYLQGSAGAVLVCDLTRPYTIQDLRLHLQNLRAASPHTQVIVAANKRDLIQDDLASQQVEQVAADLNVPYVITSAKTGDEVETMFCNLAHLMVR